MLPSRRLPRRALAAVVAALVTAVGATVAGHSAAPAVHAQSAEPLPPMCGGWRADPVVAGMGPLENLAFDGRGGMLLSEQSAVDPAAGTVWTVRPDGSPASRALYVARTFDPVTTVERIPVDGSPTPPASYRFPGWGPANAADDLAVGPDGAVYVTHNVGARVVRIEPGTGATCVVADHLWLASSVRPGSGPGWDPHALYVTSLAGTVTALTRDG